MSLVVGKDEAFQLFVERERGHLAATHLLCGERENPFVCKPAEANY